MRTEQEIITMCRKAVVMAKAARMDSETVRMLERAAACPAQDSYAVAQDVLRRAEIAVIKLAYR